MGDLLVDTITHLDCMDDSFHESKGTFGPERWPGCVTAEEGQSGRMIRVSKVGRRNVKIFSCVKTLNVDKEIVFLNSYFTLHHQFTRLNHEDFLYFSFCVFFLSSSFVLSSPFSYSLSSLTCSSFFHQFLLAFVCYLFPDFRSGAFVSSSSSPPDGNQRQPLCFVCALALAAMCEKDGTIQFVSLSPSFGLFAKWRLLCVPAHGRRNIKY